MKLWWPVVRTQHYDLLLVRLWERVPLAAVPRANDDGAMDGGAEHGAVRVPPQRALLPGHVVPVGVAAAGADGALRHHLRAVRPLRPALEETMPVLVMHQCMQVMRKNGSLLIGSNAVVHGRNNCH